MDVNEIRVPRAAWRGIPLPRPGEGSLAVAAAAGVVAWAAATVPLVGAPVRFAAGWTDVAGMLAPLVLLALFVERAVEVVMAVWRAPGARALEERLARARRRGEPADVEALEGALRTYRAASQRLAFLTGVTMSALLALAGVRALAEMLDPAVAVPAPRAGLFALVDVALTALLLAGGADGIHKLATTFTCFLETTRKRVAEAGQAAGGGGATDGGEARG